MMTAWLILNVVLTLIVIKCPSHTGRILHPKHELIDATTIVVGLSWVAFFTF